jgi:hypothetical protein
MKLVARKRFKYGGKWREVGDEFDAKSNDARFLIAIKRARAVKESNEVAEPVQAAAKPVVVAPVVVDPVVEVTHEEPESFDDEQDDAPDEANDEIETAEEVEEADDSDESTDEDVEISPRTGKPKRQYRRRDMQAED